LGVKDAGRFRIDELAPGTYKLMITHDNDTRQALYEDTFTVKSGQTHTFTSAGKEPQSWPPRAAAR
jgi:hypothetical protein